jgi:hypothetical protein
MELKKISSSRDYFDPIKKKFNPLTWHMVAEALNAAFPDYAKRFTNINIKGRYDRVVKYHRVFKRMADSISGFVWNPRTFCFDDTSDSWRRVEEGILNDEVLNNELNIVKLLRRPGNIDLEYYHRYIYRSVDRTDAESDSVINSESFISLAIEAGALTAASSRPDFFRKLSASSTTTTASTSLVVRHGGSASSSSTTVNELNQFQHPAIPMPLPLNQAPQQTHAPVSDHFNATHQQTTLHSQLQPMVPLIHPQHDTPPTPNHTSMAATVTPLSVPHQPQHEPEMGQYNGPGITDTQVSMIGQMPQQLGFIGNQANDGGAKRRKVMQRSSGGSTGYNQVLKFDSFDAGHQNLPHETALQIHREVEAMKCAVNDKILQLRMSKVISYNDFGDLQDIMEKYVPFVRSFHQRIGNDEKLLELINVYLDRV